MLRGLVVAEVMTRFEGLSNGPGGEARFNYELKPGFVMDPKDTYMLIFSINNYNALECFKEKFKGKILFESAKAINTVHYGQPRNTLVIFESSEENDQEATTEV